jgi:hypothetical protein
VRYKPDTSRTHFAMRLFSLLIAVLAVVGVGYVAIATPANADLTTSVARR